MLRRHICLSLILSFTCNFFAYFKFHSDWGRVIGKIKQNGLDCRDTASLIRISYVYLTGIWPQQWFTCSNQRLRVDSFATYAYSCRICRLEFFIAVRLKKKKIKKSIDQEYYRLLAGKCDSFTRMLQINLVPRALFPGFAGGAVSQWYGHPRVLGIPIPISLAFGDAQNADRFDFA